MQNVTGQRTRHLVEGTLDPLVGLICISVFIVCLRESQVEPKYILPSICEYSEELSETD